MNRILTAIAVMILTMVSSTGCGSGTSSDTWLIAAGGDTATVFDVGTAWMGLDEQGLEMFSSRENPVGQFVVAYARKMMLDMELESGGHLADPDVINRGEAWLRFTTGTEAIQHLRTDIRGSITDEDVRTYLDRVGKGVWYTLDPGTDEELALGPMVLADVMPTELGTQLDSMSSGMVLPAATGGMVRLDSVQLADPVLLEEVLADTAGARELAMDALTSLRSGAEMQDILDSLHADDDISVDTAAVKGLAAFYRGEEELMEMTVVASDFVNLSSTELRDEINFLASRMYAQPASEQWIIWCLDNIMMQMVLVRQQGMSADHMDSLEAQAESFMVDLASEKLYDQIISSTVTVTEEDVTHQYHDLSEPLLLPERRVLKIALVPLDEADGYRRADQEGRLEEYLDGLEGIPWLAASTSSDPQLTRPLRMEEVPGGYGDTVFQADPDSTGWLGPFPLDGSGYILMMVREVLPAGPASLEDRRTEMESAARTRLEEEATLLWMRQLEEKYGLDVNERALDDLPEDPGLWCTI